MKQAIFLLVTMAYAQPGAGPAEVLRLARERIVTSIKRLPKYTCIQTTNRSHYVPAKPHRGETPCDQMIADEKDGQKPMRLSVADRLRLDVAMGTEQEIYSWPGASRFDLTELDQIVTTGTFSTGAFGADLIDIFDNDGTRYDFRGAENRDGHNVFVYGYAVAQSVSHSHVRDGPAWFTTGYSGTFEVDPESFEIRRVTVQTPELPVETRFCQTELTLDYRRTQIGDGFFPLPRQTQMHAILRDGDESENTTTFTACREFQAESVVSFSPPNAAAEAGAVSTHPHPQIPPGLALELRLDTPIDTETSAVGDQVAATVARDVHARESKEIVIRAGAVAHGRVIRLEHHFLPFEYLVVGISFTRLERDGEPVPFRARLNGGGAPVTIVRSGSNLPPVLRPRTPVSPANAFEFPFEKRHVIAAGTVSNWITINPAKAP